MCSCMYAGEKLAIEAVSFFFKENDFEGTLKQFFLCVNHNSAFIFKAYMPAN